MPLPVSTLAAWTSMSKAAVVTSGLFIVRVAFHWSNLPTMETEDFTSNVTELDTGVTSKTGTCAQPNGVSKAVATRQSMIFRMEEVWPLGTAVSTVKNANPAQPFFTRRPTPTCLAITPRSVSPFTKNCTASAISSSPMILTRMRMPVSPSSFLTWSAPFSTK